MTQDNKRVLILLTNNFKNDSRVLKEGTSLVKAGYDVTLACYWHKILPKQEIINGIKVERIYYKKGEGKKSFFTKIRSVFYLTKFLLTIYFKYGKVEIIHCNDLSTLPIGVFIKWFRFKKKKIVYDAHEYETEVGFHVKGIIKKTYEVIERFFIRFADKVICVSDSIANEYVKLYKIPKPALVLNCPPYLESTAKRDLFRKTFNLTKEQIIFVYQGGFSKGRGIQIIIDAFKNMQDPNKVVVFMGYGELENQIKQAAQNSNNIYHHEAVTPDILLDYTSSADMGILFYENTCLNHYYCSPNKFFEYTQASLPIIVSDLYEMKRLIDKYKNGIAVEESAKALQKTIENITIHDIQKYKHNIEKMKKIYSWEEQEKILLNVYESVS